MTVDTQVWNFLFTDIEGSTRRWESDRVAMSAALARHDAILRSAIAEHAGTVFKTVGDAFCAAFASTSDAAAAAIAAQRALAAEDWGAFGSGFAELRVRMAIHAGEAEHRDDDWFGPPLNRVARLLAIGHGGQILLSAVAEGLLAGRLPSDASLHDLGPHRLRDLARPERVYQIVCGNLPSEFPPLTSLDSRPHNLPVQLTSFIGREAAISDITRRLSEPEGPRLLTLVGPGGTGKTRLALQCAAECIAAFPDGARFVDLSPLGDPELVASTIASVVGAPTPDARGLERYLAEYLSKRQLLLLLDNCEHVIATCADLAGRLLQSSPGLRILATSREPLLLAGEVSWPVPPLDLPEPGIGEGRANLHPASISGYAAVQLFVDRATAVRPGFQVTEANAPVVAELCRRLDGIPLAVELAAARVRMLPVERIAALLNDRFRLLSGDRRGAPDRQQTLRGAIDWSHDLLTEEEQTLFRRLALFRGGWSLDAAEMVCGAEPLESWAVMDILARLVEKSLVQAVDESGDERFGLLESIRAYAAERLQSAGEEEALREQHATYYRGLAAEAEPQLRGRAGPTWTRRLLREHDNLRAALEWGLETDHRSTFVLGLAGSLSPFWGDVGLQYEGRRWLDRLPEGQTDDEVAAITRLAYWRTTFGFGSVDPSRIAAQISELLPRLRALGQVQYVGWCYNDLGLCALLRGDLVEARQHCLDSLACRRQVGEAWDIAYGLANLAEVELELGNLEAAKATCDEAIVLSTDSAGRLDTRPMVIMQRGDIAIESGDLVAARACYVEGLAEAMSVGARNMIPELLARMGWLAAEVGEAHRAALLLGAAEHHFEALQRGSTWLITDRHSALAQDAARGALGEPAFQAAMAAGRALSTASAVETALEGLEQDTSPTGIRSWRKESK